MGNVNQKNNINIPKVKNDSDQFTLKTSKRMGPNHLSFQKIESKEMAFDDEENIEAQNQWLKSDSPSENNIEEYQQTPVIEQIKIKWNSFIKMKKRNFLEDYKVLKEVGKGGFGTVCKVKAKYTGVFRAAKIIQKSTLVKSQHQKLLAEMAIMINLDHPNIARLFEVYDYKKTYVLILQLCEGGELFNKIANRSLNQQSAALVMIQLLQALLYLHKKGIIHRDLKPENMLFQKSINSLKLIDFGIAAQYDGKQPLSERIGTPYYIAPEVLSKSYTQKCDLWSAGVILYMMLSFKPPFNGGSQLQLMQNILSKQVPFKQPNLRNVSKQGMNFLKNLLNKNPSLRFSAVQAFEHLWIQKHLTLSLKSHREVIRNIESFKFDDRLQAVVFTFIVAQILNSQQKKQLKQLFFQIDTNHDGVLSQKELQIALSKVQEIKSEKVKLLMRLIDTNGSGQIDFTEFITATYQPQRLTADHFEQAFNYFDIDHSGSITYDEITVFLQNGQHSYDEIQKIFQQVDINHDGQISKQEFVSILTKKIKERIEKTKKQKNKKSEEGSNSKV